MGERNWSEGKKKKKQTKWVSCFSFVWNNDLWIKGDSADTEVKGCVVNSDQEKRKRFGLLQCKCETQESTFAFISLIEYKHAFLSS